MGDGRNTAPLTPPPPPPPPPTTTITTETAKAVVMAP